MPRQAASNPGFKLSVGAPLLAATGLAWYLSAELLQSSTMGMNSASAVIPIASMASYFAFLDVGAISSFLVAWVVGMVAMMFPAMVPILSLYSRVTESDAKNLGVRRIAGLPFFIAGYLSLYAVLGLSFFSAVSVAFQLGSFMPWSPFLSVAGVACVLFTAGVWQLTPLKEKSLAKCISPVGFFLTHGKKGLSGSFRMGAEHGIYCVGCCWLYMLVMLAVAAMNLPSMVLLSGLMTIEKVFVGKSRWFKWLSAGFFFLLSALAIVFPVYLASL